MASLRLPAFMVAEGLILGRAVAPLKVKEVRIAGRRYVVCLNEGQGRKDQADRKTILGAFQEQLKRGAKSLVGNKGYRRNLRSGGPKFEIGEAKVKAVSRFDGKWVLQTDRKEMSLEEVMVRYKQLRIHDEMFRAANTRMETRPIYHQCDETVRGHGLYSFLALMRRKQLQHRLEAACRYFRWAEVLNDLEALQLTQVARETRQVGRFRQDGARRCVDTGPRGQENG